MTSDTARRLLLGRLSHAFQLPEGRSGFLLRRVAKGSPADRLGLVGGSIPVTIGDTQILIGGDILLEAMGQRLDSPDIGLALMNALRDVTPTSRISVVILRSGTVLKLEAAAADPAPWLARTRK